MLVRIQINDKSIFGTLEPDDNVILVYAGDHIAKYPTTIHYEEVKPDANEDPHAA